MGKLRTTRKGNATTIDFSGPFFDKDPDKTFDENLGEMLQAMAEEGAQDVRAQIDSHQSDMPQWTGWSASKIAPRRSIPMKKDGSFALIWTSTEGLAGRPKVWQRGEKTKNARGNLAGDFKGNVAARTLAAMSTIEGRWHPFRVTKNRLSRSRSVNMAELTKGLE
jgi:hypothetical protein